MNHSKNNSGFSLIEIIVAISLTGVLMLAMTSLLSFLNKNQSQGSLTSNVLQMQNKIQSLLLNESAWDHTLGAATTANPLNTAGALGCIPNGLNCAHIVKPAPATNPPDNAYYLGAPFIALPILEEVDGTVYIDSSVATNGFTENGTPCPAGQQFDPVNGNDACPIRWELRVALICPNATASCNNPTVDITGVLRFSPSTNNSRFTSLNTAKYRVHVTRGSRGQNRSEFFEAVRQATGANAGGGTCAVGAWTDAPLTTLNVNENTNAALAAPGVTVQPGTYNCSFSITCFECGGFQSRLVYPGGPALAPASLAKSGVLARSGLDNIAFTVLAPTTLRLQYLAEKVPEVATPANYCLGMTLPDYSDTTKFSFLNCIRIY